MTKKLRPTDLPKFRPGDKVILQHADKDDPEAAEFGIMTGREYGVIVATWWDDFLGAYDCWIAFYGKRGFPKDPSKTKPYILKYFETSLTAWKK
jgi:hypothetical protein